MVDDESRTLNLASVIHLRQAFLIPWYRTLKLDGVFLGLGLCYLGFGDLVIRKADMWLQTIDLRLLRQ